MKTIVITVFAASALFLLGCSSGDNESETDSILRKTKEAVLSSIDLLAASASRAAPEIAASGLGTTETRTTLSSLVIENPGVIDASTVDTRGILVAVEPPPFQHAEGVDISTQPQVASIIEEHQPALSELFLAVEGFPALDLEWPLLGEDETFLGSLSLLLDHVTLFESATAAVIGATRYSLTIQQLDGTILYDADPSQVGRNVLTDPEFQSYPDLIRQVQDTIEAESGSGSYTFTKPGSNELVSKSCQWTTIYRFGAQWRVVIFWEP